MSLLHGHDISVSLGSRPVLEQASLTVKAGQVVGLIGPNGAGKTTLLRALCGLQSMQHGSITVNDRPLTDIPPRQRAQTVAYLPQGAESHWQVSVSHLVALGRLPHQAGALSTLDRQAITRAMDACDVTHLADRSVAEVSGGERARVMLARALAVEPTLLLADEPVAGLDPAHQLEVMQRLHALADGGAGVIVVLHDLTLAARYCHHLVLLNRGQVVASGPPNDVLTPTILADIYGIRAHQGEVDGVPYLVPLERLPSTGPTP